MSYEDEDYEDDGIESLLDDDDADDDYEGLNDYSAYGSAGWQPERFEDYLYDRAGKDSHELQSYEGWYAESYGKKLLDSFLDHVDGMEDEHLDNSIPEYERTLDEAITEIDNGIIDPSSMTEEEWFAYVNGIEVPKLPADYWDNHPIGEKIDVPKLSQDLSGRGFKYSE